MLDWMVRAALLSALLGLSATALERALRDRRRPARMLWLAVMVLSVILPLLALVLPRWWPSSLKLGAPINAAAFVVALREYSAAAAGEPAPSGVQMLPFLWLAASGFLALRYGWSWWRLQRALTHAQPFPLAGAQVWITSGVGPAVVGVWRQRIVIPAWVLSLSDDQKRMVVCHEQEHLRVRDHWILGLMPLAVVAFPWNAALWWQLFRLRRSIELDCDARVLRSGVPAQAYGALLLAVASGPAAREWALPALARRGNLLRQRLQSLLRPVHRARRTVTSVRLVVAVLCVFAALLMVLPDSRPLLAQRRDRVTAQRMQEKPDPAIVIDETIVTPGSLVDVVVDRIVGFEELDAAAAVARFGAEASAGAIVIRTTSKTFVTRTAPTPGSNSLDVTVRLRRLDNLSVQTGILDVRRISSIGLSLGRVGNVLASEVLSVRVLKGDAAFLRGAVTQQGTIQLVLRSDYLERLRLAR